MNTTIENLPVGTTLQLQGFSCRIQHAEKPVNWTVTKRVCELLNQEEWICDSTGRVVLFQSEKRDVSNGPHGGSYYPQGPKGQHRVSRMTEKNNFYVVFCTATVIS